MTLYRPPSAWTDGAPFTGGSSSASDATHVRRDAANFLMGVTVGGGRVVDSCVPTNVTLSTLDIETLQLAATGDPVVGDEVLLASQSTKSQNGIYTVTDTNAPCLTKNAAQPNVGGIVGFTVPVFQGDDNSESEVSLLRRTADNQYLRLDSRASRALADHMSDPDAHGGGGGGGGQTLMYVNVFAEAASGTYADAETYLLGTNGSTGQAAGRTLYVFDGTDAGLFQSQGPSLPAILYPRQPQVGDTYNSHIYSDPAGGTYFGQRTWECRNDLGIGSPHGVMLYGANVVVASGTKTLKHDDVVIVDLSGDATLELPQAGWTSDPARRLWVFVRDLNGHTLTVDPNGDAVEGITTPFPITEGWWVLVSDNTEWKVPMSPLVLASAANSNRMGTYAVSADTTLAHPAWVRLNDAGLTVTLPTGLTTKLEIESVVDNASGGDCFIDGTVNGVTNPTVPAGKVMRLYVEFGGGWRGFLADRVA